MILRSICLYFWSVSQVIKRYICQNASNKTWINENDICWRVTFSRYDTQRKPMQIWFWAMTNKCIMYYLTSDCFSPNSSQCSNVPRKKKPDSWFLVLVITCLRGKFGINLPSSLFWNFEISPVKRGRFQNFQKWTR